MIDEVRATETEIMSRLTQAAKENNVVLTHAHKIFFLRLLKYATKNGNTVDAGMEISKTVADIAEIINIPVRTVIQSINRLCKCAAIQRVEPKGTFPRSPAKTIVNKKFYEKEISDENS